LGVQENCGRKFLLARPNRKFADRKVHRSRAGYSKNGEFDKALDDCNAIIRVNPRNAVAYRVCGVAYQGKGDVERL